MATRRFAWIVAVGCLALVAAAAVPALAGAEMPFFHGGPGGHHGGRGTIRPGPYNLTFNETGLPNGTFWSVELCGASTPNGSSWSPQALPDWGRCLRNGTGNSSVAFPLANGSYRYQIHTVEVGNATYGADPSVGTLPINGSGATIDVTFAALVPYNVTFVESGLPTGTVWSVQFVGGHEWARGNASNTSEIGFNRTNGTYSYTVGSACANSTVYLPTPAGGSVTVNGSAVEVTIAFASLTFYNVSFVETGLPSGTFWSVSLVGNGSGHAPYAAPDCGSFDWNGSANATVNFTVPNGNYSFFVGNASNGTEKFAPTPMAGNVTVDGGNVTIDVTFAAVVEYNVTFNETGLPNGTLWWVVVDGPSTGVEFNASDGNLTTFALANGSYHFSVWSTDSNCSTPRTPSPAAGTVTVSGANVVVRVTFSS